MEKIDFEKLRKKMTQTDIFRGLAAGLPSSVSSANNVQNATPEQLLSMARKRGINLEKFYFDKYKKD